MNNATSTERRSLGSAWIVALVGAWMIISPFVLHFSSNRACMLNNIATGIALIVVTLASARFELLRGLLVMLGGWMYASSVLLVVSEKMFLWNNLLLAMVVILSTVASSSPYPPGYVPRGK